MVALALLIFFEGNKKPPTQSKGKRSFDGRISGNKEGRNSSIMNFYPTFTTIHYNTKKMACQWTFSRQNWTLLRKN